MPGSRTAVCQHRHLEGPPARSVDRRVVASTESDGQRRRRSALGATFRGLARMSSRRGCAKDRSRRGVVVACIGPYGSLALPRPNANRSTDRPSLRRRAGTSGAQTGHPFRVMSAHPPLHHAGGRSPDGRRIDPEGSRKERSKWNGKREATASSRSVRCPSVPGVPPAATEAAGSVLRPDAARCCRCTTPAPAARSTTTCSERPRQQQRTPI